MTLNVHYSFDPIIIPGIATAETFFFFNLEFKALQEKNKVKDGKNGSEVWLHYRK